MTHCKASVDLRSFASEGRTSSLVVVGQRQLGASVERSMVGVSPVNLLGEPEDQPEAQPHQAC
jgi:hypothetical protein